MPPTDNHEYCTKEVHIHACKQNTHILKKVTILKDTADINPAQLGMVEFTCDPSPEELEARESEVQCHCQLPTNSKPAVIHKTLVGGGFILMN